MLVYPLYAKSVAQSVSGAYRCSPKVFTVPCPFRHYHYTTLYKYSLLAGFTYLYKYIHAMLYLYKGGDRGIVTVQ